MQVHFVLVNSSQKMVGFCGLIHATCTKICSCNTGNFYFYSYPILLKPDFKSAPLLTLSLWRFNATESIEERTNGVSSYTFGYRRTAEIFNPPLPHSYSQYLWKPYPFIYMHFRWKSRRNHTFYNNVHVINVKNAGDKWLYLSMFQTLRMLTTGHLVTHTWLESFLKDEFQLWTNQYLLQFKSVTSLPVLCAEKVKSQWMIAKQIVKSARYPTD
jgi:hypothetical protein